MVKHQEHIEKVVLFFLRKDASRNKIDAILQKFSTADWQMLYKFLIGTRLFYSKQSKNTLINTKFFSGPESFILGLKRSLELLGMPAKRLYCEGRNNPFYYLRYCHTDSLRLFKILYKDLANDLYLKRKYDKFKAVIYNA